MSFGNDGKYIRAVGTYRECVVVLLRCTKVKSSFIVNCNSSLLKKNRYYYAIISLHNRV